MGAYITLKCRKNKNGLMDLDYQAVRAVHVRDAGNAKVGGGGCCQYRGEVGDGRGSQDLSQGCPCLLMLLGVRYTSAEDGASEMSRFMHDANRA
jgi:hypothetical protein